MKFVYLIGSSIDVSNENALRYWYKRSFFTTEQRLSQTLKTVENIKTLDPQAEIYLIDSSEKVFTEFTDLAQQDQRFHYVRIQDHNSELAHKVRTHVSKSHGECLLFLEFFRHYKSQLKQFDYVVKISGRYNITSESYTRSDEIFNESGKDHWYFIGPQHWDHELWKHVKHLYPNDVADSEGKLNFVITSLFCVGVNRIEDHEVLLAAATALTDTTNKLYYMDIEYIMYYLFKQMNWFDRTRSLPWQVEGLSGQTGQYTVYPRNKPDKPKQPQSQNLYDIKKFGYLPAYMGRDPGSWSKKFSKSVAVSFDNVVTDEQADFRVVVQCEPPQIYSAFPGMVRDNAEKFDLILSYNNSLSDLPGFELFVPVGCFVDELPLNKTNQISYIMSSKILTDEHRMRFMILRALENSKKIGQFDFIMHRNPPEIPSKNDFFVNAKFHITCENSVMENMFSEKIIDCFRTRTVPIYFGCVNIDKFFNPKGIIRFNTIEEFNQICLDITPEWYEERLPYIEENYQLARPYWEKTVYQRVEDLIDKHLASKYPDCVSSPQ